MLTRERHVALDERLEHRAELRRLDAASRVLDADVHPWSVARRLDVGRGLLRGAGADGDLSRRIGARGRELDGVRQQIDEDLTHALLVAPRTEPRRIATDGIRDGQACRPRLR